MSQEDKYNVMELFAGIGGSSYAGKLICNWRTVCYVEWDEYCQKVIKARIEDGIFDEAPIWDDIQTFDGIPWRGAVDIVTGGFPCQPFSVAGKQQGEADERNMWPDTLRIISEVRPRFAFLENVPALITSRYFGRVIGELSEIGYDCRWTIVSAADVGAPHLRKRLWILGYPNQRHIDEDKEIQSRRSKFGLSGSAMAYPNSDGAVRHEPKHGQGCGTVEGGQIRNTASEGFPDGRGSQVGRPEQVTQPERPDCTWWDIDPADLPDTGGSGSPGQGRTERPGNSASQGNREINRINDDCGRSVIAHVGRVAHGVPDRCNRLKGLGNAWVPAVAATAWNILTEGLE